MLVVEGDDDLTLLGTLRDADDGPSNRRCSRAAEKSPLPIAVYHPLSCTKQKKAQSIMLCAFRED